MGYTIGDEALKGVNQPDARPSKLKARKANSSQQKAVVMLKEEDIINTVKARIDGKGKKARPQKKSQAQNKPSTSKVKPSEKTS